MKYFVARVDGKALTNYDCETNSWYADADSAPKLFKKPTLPEFQAGDTEARLNDERTIEPKDIVWEEVDLKVQK